MNDDKLRAALDDANGLIEMMRRHLGEDHPDCAYAALGVMNDASRAALAASPTDEGPRHCDCTRDADLNTGNTCPSCGHRDHGRLGCGKRIAASATDEGPDPAECAICGDYVAGGQPVHNICVAELTAKAEDARPAVPALDEERYESAWDKDTEDAAARPAVPALDDPRDIVIDLLGEVGFLRSCIASGEKLSQDDLDRQNKAMARAAEYAAEADR